MRILFISNFYPPHHIGGCEIRLSELVHRLQKRGHQTCILTSGYRATGSSAEDNIHRLLALESDLVYYSPGAFFWRRKRNDRANLAQLRRLVEQFNPDILLFYCMWNLSPSIPYYAEQLCPGRVVYQVSGDWPYAPTVHEQYWRAPTQHWYTRLPKKLLATAAFAILESEPQSRTLKFEHVIAVSQAVKRDLVEKAGIPPEHIAVIYGGTDAKPFLAYSALQRTKSTDGILRLLCAGSLAWHKGFHTVIQALAKVVNQPGLPDLTLTIVGSGHPDYEVYLKDLAQQERVAEIVEFRPHIPREQMPALLGQFDIFVLPSHYEAMSRMLQEAMATGLAVVGTASWGTKEILIEAQNGLTFAPEDVKGLAAQLERLARDPLLRRRLAEAGQRTVLKRFTLKRMVDEFETYLEDLLVDMSPA